MINKQNKINKKQNLHYPPPPPNTKHSLSSFSLALLTVLCLTLSTCCDLDGGGNPFEGDLLPPGSDDDGGGTTLPVPPPCGDTSFRGSGGFVDPLYRMQPGPLCYDSHARQQYDWRLLLAGAGHRLRRDNSKPYRDARRPLRRPPVPSRPKSALRTSASSTTK